MKTSCVPFFHSIISSFSFFFFFETIVKKISVLSVGHLGPSLSSADLVELSSVDLVDRAFFLFPINVEFFIVFVI